MKPVNAARSAPPATGAWCGRRFRPICVRYSASRTAATFRIQAASLMPGTARGGLDRFDPGQPGDHHRGRRAGTHPAERADQQIGARVDLGVGDPLTGQQCGVELLRVRASSRSIRPEDRRTLTEMSTAVSSEVARRRRRPPPDSDPGIGGDRRRSRRRRLARSVARRAVSAWMGRNAERGDAVITGEHDQSRPFEHVRPGSAQASQQTNQRAEGTQQGMRRHAAALVTAA